MKQTVRTALLLIGVIFVLYAVLLTLHRMPGGPLGALPWLGAALEYPADFLTDALELREYALVITPPVMVIAAALVLGLLAVWIFARTRPGALRFDTDNGNVSVPLPLVDTVIRKTVADMEGLSDPRWELDRRHGKPRLKVSITSRWGPAYPGTVNDFIEAVRGEIKNQTGLQIDDISTSILLTSKGALPEAGNKESG